MLVKDRKAPRQTISPVSFSLFDAMHRRFKHRSSLKLIGLLIAIILICLNQLLDSETVVFRTSSDPECDIAESSVDPFYP